MKAFKFFVESMIKQKTGIYTGRNLTPAQVKSNNDAKDEIRKILKPSEGKVGLLYDVPDPKVSIKYLSISC